MEKWGFRKDDMRFLQFFGNCIQGIHSAKYQNKKVMIKNAIQLAGMFVWGFHPEQLTGHSAMVSSRRKFLPNSKLTQVKLILGSLPWGHINSKASGHSDRIYSIWLSFIISMINYGYAWLIKGFIHIFLSIIDLLSSNLVVLTLKGPVPYIYGTH